MKKYELLAPVGSIEALYAAVNNGANAVYLGGSDFGARKKVGFSNEELINAVNYAHLYNVKVYVTINTLIYEEELEQLYPFIDFLVNEAYVDAIIVQDLGVLDYLRQTYPSFEIHASTQMHVHNKEAVKELLALGVKRVVVPREMSIDEIKAIKEATNADLEVFVHGALCVSYSGQCLMSYINGGRSGNRGDCAQSCRQQYELFDVTNGSDNKVASFGDYLLSPKDLNSINNIGKLIDIGVDSFKIEGRLKRPEYVAVVTKLYRKAIDSYLTFGKVDITEDDMNDLKKIFNRDFTDGYLMNNRQKELMNIKTPNHQGIEIGKVTDISKNSITVKLTNDINFNDGLRIDTFGLIVNNMYLKNELVKKAKVNDSVTLRVSFEPTKALIGSTVLKTSDEVQLINARSTYEEQCKIDVTLEVKAKLNEPLEIIMTDDLDNIVSAKSNALFERALKEGISKERLTEQVSKLGNTPFRVIDITIAIEDGIIMPIKEINELRRNLVDSLVELRTSRCKHEKQEYFKLYPSQEKTNEITFEVYSQELFDYIKTNTKYNVYLNEFDNVKTEFNSDYHNVASELGGVFMYNAFDANYSLNVINTNAISFLINQGAKKICLSLESDMTLTKDIVRNLDKSVNLEYVIYGKRTLMTTWYCPINLTSRATKDRYCNICRGKEYKLKDRFGKRYDILTSKDCLVKINESTAMNQITEVDTLKKLGISNFKIILTNETIEEVLEIINKVSYFD